MKIIVAGTRTFDNYSFLSLSIHTSIASLGLVPSKVEIVSGCAKGADLLGERWALENGAALAQFPADWNKHGRAAGPIRNEQMANYGDVLIAFWDGKSRGTLNMINHMKRLGKDYVIFDYTMSKV